MATRIQRLKVRVVSPWFGSLETDEASFSSALPLQEADALLSDWAPSDELFTFQGRKAWYCCEPECQFNELDSGKWPKFRSQLKVGEFLSHNQADRRYRVPHVTHFEPLSLDHSTSRLNKAIAIVSNYGGDPRRRHPGLSYRNLFVTSELVDLFGRSGWKRYKQRVLSRRAAPANYRGEIPGDWPASEKRSLLSRYKVAVCLENMTEQNYFTEKFVEAVCAGCIPVYQPDDETAAGPLKGAFWVDPRNYGGLPAATISAALDLDSAAVHEQNRGWLATNKDLAGTHHLQVFSRIGRILAGE